MPAEAPYGPFSLAAIRRALKARVEATSIRAVAQEIGLSPSGLHVVLQGSRPHPQTRQKLVAWYATLREGAGRADVPRDDLDAAVDLLRLYISANGRSTVQQRRIREVLHRLLGEQETEAGKE